ncbi:nuclear pore complex protein Nup85 isoform X3 [Hydra vulgaris]|uniref:Nuclear pore complex protein Nup85 n=1 Tax=Hydra vulgaris TaxID=6087 RepID=A0ABM4D2E0_HYDVU
MVYEHEDRGLLDSKWVGSSSMMIYYRPNQLEADFSTNDSQMMREIHWSAQSSQNSINRKLFNETREIFLSLQESCEEEKPTLDVLLKISHQYRAVIQSCVVKLREKIKLERDKVISEDMKTQLDLLIIMELLWNLCEALFIESQAGGYCMKPLLNWVKWHFDGINHSVHSLLSTDDPYSDPIYWNTIYGLVLQGRLSDVCDLLKHHPYRDEGRFDAFENIEELMTKMPLLQAQEGQSVTDFLKKWDVWSKECESRLEGGDFSQYPEVEEICMLLCGKDSALLKHKNICESWYEIMVAKLLYTQPTVSTFNLKQIAVDCLELFNGIDNVSALDEIVLSILSFDIHTVVEKSSEIFPNWWFVMHLTDLLYHCDLLKSYNIDYGAELREFLLLEYSASLMSHPSLWSTAAEYFLNSPTHGRDYLAAYIERIPLDCEKKALKLIHICKTHGFPELIRDICKVMGMKAIRRKRLGVALSWCLRSKDEAFASIITDQFLDYYKDTGSFTQCDLIENLGSSMLLHNKLTFLGKYYDFHKLYADGNFLEASNLLVSLLTSNLAPKKFWLSILIDALPLLEHEELLFNSEQTYELMQCLEELHLCFDRKLSKSKVVSDDEKDHVEMLSLALSNNLSRALLC